MNIAILKISIWLNAELLVYSNFPKRLVSMSVFGSTVITATRNQDAWFF